MAEEFRGPSGVDQRREARGPWSPVFKGRMSLRSAGRADQPVQSFRDLSNRGASVLVAGAIAAGQQVALRLETDGATMEFMATVAWCRPDPEGTAADQDGARAEPLFAVGLTLRAPLSFVTMMQGYSAR